MGGGPSSPPPAPGIPAMDPALLNASARNAYHSKPNAEMSTGSGQVLLAYPSVAQLWSYSADDCAFCISGSTFGVVGKIITAHFILSTASKKTQPATIVNLSVDSNPDADPELSSDHSHSSPSQSSSPKSPYDDKGMLSAEATRNLVLLQVLRKETIYLEVHQLNKKPSFVKSLVLPPASSGPGPYSIYSNRATSALAVITTSGVVTLFSVPQFLPLPLSGLETRLNPEGIPLFDMSGRWLAYCPKNLSNETLSRSNTSSALGTPLKLPPPGLVLDRILENISSTTASSIKSISDAGVAGIRNYLSSSTSPYGTTLADTYAKKQQANIILVGNNKFSIDSSGRVALTKDSAAAAGLSSPTTPAAVVAALPNALSSLFQAQANSSPVQVIDIETQKPICTFIPPQGVSHLSLSPYAATLATVSLRGDAIFTFDLSFVPLQVSLTGKYIRGMTPAKVHQVEWDADGGFGIITRDKGSVHWFERQPWNTYESLSASPSEEDLSTCDNLSSPSSGGGGLIGFRLGSTAAGAASLIKSAPFKGLSGSNKKWKLSGWNVQGMILASNKIGKEKDPRVINEEESLEEHNSSGQTENGSTSLEEIKYSNVLMLREGQLLVVDVKSGTTCWKYDLPWHPVAENFLTPEIGIEIVREANASNAFVNSVPPENSAGGAKPSSIVSKIHPSEEADTRQQAIKVIEPLAFFEMHPCLPYPLLHTDRHIVLATYEEEEKEEYQGNDNVFFPKSMFGLPINSKELDFGRAKGLVQFSGPGRRSHDVLSQHNGFANAGGADEDGSSTTSGTPLFSDVDDHILREMDSAVEQEAYENRDRSAESTTAMMMKNEGEEVVSKAAELELAMQSMVVFEKHEEEEDPLMIVM